MKKMDLSQQDLRRIITDAYEQPVKSITFNLGTRMDGTVQGERREVATFMGCTVKFRDAAPGYPSEVDLLSAELRPMIVDDFDKQGYTVDIMDGINFNMSTRMVGSTPESRRTIPVFRGCTVDYQEKVQTINDVVEPTDEDFDKEQSPFTSLADMRREELAGSLNKLSNRELCEAARAHFASHPTLPGEKSLKDEANRKLSILENDPAVSELNLFLFPAEKESFARRLAQTRIREIPVNMAGKHFNDLYREPVAEIPQNNSAIYVSRADVALEKDGSGNVRVCAASRSVIEPIEIDRLPSKSLTNNPMNVDWCRAELQIADYSNGKGKNLSTRVVVDTDLMSGDAVDLSDDMLAGLDKVNGLEQ